MRKLKFTEDNLYHIYNRGTEKRNIFLDTQDYFRAVHNLYEFNDEQHAMLLYYKKPLLDSYEAKPHSLSFERHKRKPLVELLTFTLMPNHYHLLLRQLRGGGIREFMHRFGTGYTMYFNQKYERTGRLFESTFKAIQVEHEAHFIHLPFYIHANPLDLKFPEWRERKLKNSNLAMEFLKKYRWSSFQDYIGSKNFPSVTERSFLTQVIGHPKKFETMTASLLNELDIGSIENIAIEPIDTISKLP